MLGFVPSLDFSFQSLVLLLHPVPSIKALGAGTFDLNTKIMEPRFLSLVLCFIL